MSITSKIERFNVGSKVFFIEQYTNATYNWQPVWCYGYMIDESMCEVIKGGLRRKPSINQLKRRFA